jgi:two-component system, OmpR family, sensor kinase
VSRLPVRVRLALTYALAVVVVLAAACAFVFLQLRSDMDQAVTGALETRMTAALSLLDNGKALGFADAGLLGERDESLAQLLRPDGQMVFSLGAVHVAALTGADLRRATRGRVIVERRLPGFDDAARVLARPAPGTNGRLVVAVGQSLTDRNEALASLVRAFVVAGSLAVVLASLVGYALATIAMAPVETMRRRAAAISLTGEPERLPLGRAHDEISRLGETLNAMLDRLRRSFERERRFVADASHELRSPIAVIKTELEGVLRSGRVSGEQRAALVAAVEECDRLAELAEDLLVLARSADGRLPIRPEPLAVRPLLDATRHRFVDRAAERGRAIRVEAPEDLVVLADELRMRQALANLVDNAVRHGGGEIELRGRGTPEGVEIDVTDHGGGFGEEFAARAFERFTRAGESRSGDGSGLGLAIVQAIATAHGGRATIAEGAAGTTVRLVFPPAPPDAPPAPDRGASIAGASAPSQVPLI